MKIKKGFVLRDIAGENVVIGEGLEQINFNKMLSLNSTAAYLWQEVVDLQDFDAEMLAGLLLNRYDVSEEQARADAADLVERWQDAGVIEENS